MNAFETYCLYLGINNHFFKPSYNYFRYGPVPVKPETFEGKPYAERFRYERLSKKFSDKEDLENFLVANFSSAIKKVWVGDLFGGGADERYTEWLGRITSAQYNATSQVKKLAEKYPFNDLFVTIPGQHPEILKAHLRGDLTLETFVLLDMCVNFFQKLDKDLHEDNVWIVLKNKADKYRPFIKRLDLDIAALRKALQAAILDAFPPAK